MNDPKAQGKNGSAIGVTTRLKVKADETNGAVPLLTGLAIAGTRFPGSLNAEITPPTALHNEWIIVQRFSTEPEAVAWRDSTIRKEKLAQLSPHLMESGVADETLQQMCDGSVAACISSLIKPGLEEDYYAWLLEIQTAQALSPGYQGTYLQMQKSGDSHQWTTMLRFNSPESIDIWFKSKRRLELIEEAKKFISSESIKRLTSSFPGWMPVDQAGDSPANWKAAALVVLGLYPIVCLQIKYLSPALHDLKLALANFIGNVMSVALVTWLTMPILTNVFGKWLLPPKDRDNTSIEIGGLIAVLVLFASEVLVFWNFIP
jgi:antibiotic biosynthesis monooxygenase (ABM) superfamily enzyme